MERKKIIVTGGAGFIGANLCRRLLKDGHYITCLDNLCTGRRENIKNLERNPKFNFIKLDISKAERLGIPSGVNEIYNLACPASPPQYHRLGQETIDVCTIGMRNMLELAVENHAKILQASTSECYGDPLVHPQHVSYHGNVNCFGRRAKYDEGKRVAEARIWTAMESHPELDAKIVRIFNTYGPYMDPEDGRVVSNFIIQALTGQPITIYGDGSQTRSFCFVDDLVEGMIRMMSTEKYLQTIIDSKTKKEILVGRKIPGTKKYGPGVINLENGLIFTPVLNLGNPREMMVLEFAELVKRLTKTKSEIELYDLPRDDPTKRQPDILLTTINLSWEPKVSLEDGLKKTIEYFKRELKKI